MASTQLPNQELNESPHILVIHSDDESEPLTKEEMSVMNLDYDCDEEENGMCSGRFRCLVVSADFVWIVALLALLLPGIRNKSNLEILRTPARIPVEYACHIGEGHQVENIDSAMVDVYETASRTITDNMTEFLAEFRESNFDNWGKTYTQVKEGMRHFKSTYFPPYLQDGSTIYESASGIGLNLYMTLEILQETKGVENLFVYGNELLEASASKANAVFDHIAPANSHKGVICAGDSGHLEFVPSNSFDLVYSGYIRYGYGVGT